MNKPHFFFVGGKPFTVSEMDDNTSRVMLNCSIGPLGIYKDADEARDDIKTINMALAQMGLVAKFPLTSPGLLDEVAPR